MSGNEPVNAKRVEFVHKFLEDYGKKVVDGLGFKVLEKLLPPKEVRSILICIGGRK